MKSTLPRRPIPIIDFVKTRRSLDDVPQVPLLHMSVKMYLIGALVWDYADTVCDIAISMRRHETKRLCRAVRELRLDYDRTRALDLDDDHVEREWRLAELFESINRDNFAKLCAGLRTEIRRDTRLDAENVMLVEAVQMTMTLIDALRLFAAECDGFIRRYYPQSPHSILPDHFTRLAVLIPEFAGDCYDAASHSRRVTAGILLKEINQIELYGTD